MAREPKAAVTSGPNVTFEVDRFEWTADDRLELAGRWFGVRGRRFLRPTLEVEVDDGNRRLLALLEHKPWTAVDGEEWVAAFAWQGDPIAAAAELAVGSDLAVELPAPGTAARKGRKGPAKPAAGRAGTTTAHRADKTPVERREARRPRLETLERELGSARAQAQRVGEELDRVRTAFEAQTDRLRTELTAAEQAKQRLDAELGEARDRIEAAEAAADRQREELRRERDAAVSERDSALAVARQAKRDRDTAVRERTAVEHERDAAEQARDRALEKSDSSLSGAQTAAAERDHALNERDEAAAQRDAAAVARDAAAAERDSAAAERDAALVRRRTVPPIGGPPAQGEVPVVSFSPIVAGSRGPTLGPRVVVFAVLTVFAVALAVLLATAIW
ncbi:MAG: hypothetical protein AABM31_02215 [Actinomycetota bacterium]